LKGGGMNVRKTENRRFTRSKAQLPVEVTLPCGVMLEGTLIDVGMGGSRIHTDRQLPVGNECEMTVVFDPEHHAGRFRFHCYVARADEAGMALSFTGADEASFSRLGDLVADHSPDTVRTEQEIEQFFAARQ
jgi:hypothetical protein